MKEGVFFIFRNYIHPNSMAEQGQQVENYESIGPAFRLQCRYWRVRVDTELCRNNPDMSWETAVEGW